MPAVAGRRVVDKARGFKPLFATNISRPTLEDPSVVCQSHFNALARPAKAGNIHVLGNTRLTFDAKQWSC